MTWRPGGGFVGSTEHVNDRRMCTWLQVANSLVFLTYRLASARPPSREIRHMSSRAGKMRVIDGSWIGRLDGAYQRSDLLWPTE